MATPMPSAILYSALGKSKETAFPGPGGLRNISLLIKKELILALLGIITAHDRGELLTNQHNEIGYSIIKY